MPNQSGRIVGDSAPQQTPYRCESRNHGLGLLLIVPSIYSREVARPKRSRIGHREHALQLLDFSNALFCVHPSQYLTEPPGGQTAPEIPMTDQHALPYS
jgi:hypothetical protein